MIKKHHQILAGILVAQIIVSVVVFWPRPATAGQREPLFPDLDVEDVTSLTIEDAEGQIIELEEVTGEWVLPKAGQYPAKADAVNPLLEKLASLTTGRLVTSSDTSHRRLQVASDDFVRRVTFGTGQGGEQTIYLGSSPQYSSIHFRLEGQSETYLTSELTTWDVSPAASTWIDTNYQTVGQNDVTKMTLENAKGTFVFEKADEETWAVVDLSSAEEGEASLDEDRSLDQSQVRAILSRATSLTMRRPLGKEEQDAYGMDEPNAVVTLEAADKTATLRVGVKDDDADSYVVKSSESAYYVHVPETSLRALVESGLDAFFKEPTPQAESSGS